MPSFVVCRMLPIHSLIDPLISPFQQCLGFSHDGLLFLMTKQDIRTADWTQFITQFWPAVIASAFTLKGAWALMTTGQWGGCRGST